MQLWKHRNGKWYILHGPRLKRRISTGTPDRREAEIKLSQFIAGGQEPTLSEISVQAILEGYRDDHGKGLRGQCGLRYGITALVRRLGDLKPDHLTPTVIKRYAAERGAADGTILREVGILRAALGWAKNHNLIVNKPQIPNPVKAPPGRKRWMTKAEAETLLGACVEPHVKLFITLALSTCARMGAILEARWGQVDWERKRIDFGEGHRNKRRTIVPIEGDAFEALEAAKRLSCSDYIVEFRGKPLKTMKTGFAAACRRAGLSGVTPHILRHTGASWAVEAGIPDEEVGRMLGISAEMVRKVYGHFSPNYLRGAVAALQLNQATPKGALHVKGKDRTRGHKKATNRES